MYQAQGELTAAVRARLYAPVHLAGEAHPHLDAALGELPEDRGHVGGDVGCYLAEQEPAGHG